MTASPIALDFLLWGSVLGVVLNFLFRFMDRG